MATRNQLPDVLRGDRGVWGPLREMNRLQRRMDRFFDELLTDSRSLMPSEEGMERSPACDVVESQNHYLVSFDLPGVKKEDVKIELQEHQLMVSGERKQEVSQEHQGQMSHERFHGSFRRTFMLPSKVDADKVQAHYENGVLQIMIPKTEVSSSKQIPIKEGKMIESKTGKAA